MTPSVEQAMIFAAGLGTRLRPLTDSIPKALVKVAGKPMLEHLISKMKAHGVQRIIINLHHFDEKIRAFVAGKNYFGLEIHFSSEPQMLLDTGGGLKNAAHLFDHTKPVLLHNVDVFSNVDFGKMMQHHLKQNALATLFVQKRESSRYFLFDENMRLAGWRNAKSGEEILVRNQGRFGEFGFNGIHIISPEIFKLITEKGKFPIVPVYLRLAQRHFIGGYRDDAVAYIDAGKPESIALAGRIATL
jgi:N-acetyl-alpha-D-muramate 1-phosphate uridylyltransferase